MVEKVLQINGYKKYFISSLGFAFKVSNGKEYKIEPNVINGIHKVKIGNQKLSLPYLMLEYFKEDLPKTFNYTYKYTNGFCRLKDIKILDCSNASDLELIKFYKCDKKASSSNSRVNNTSKICSNDVLNSLKRMNFRCTYCNESINHRNWHLDHVQPLSKDGLNISTNITPSCKWCNQMKADAPVDLFLSKCEKILKNFK